MLKPPFLNLNGGWGLKRKKCNYDCFNCQYPDCVADDDSYLYESELLDQKILDERRKNEIDSIITLETEASSAKKRGRPRKTEESKALRRKITCRLRYQRDRERLLAQSKAYYHQNKNKAEFIERRRKRDRERYLRRKGMMNERTDEPI